MRTLRPYQSDCIAAILRELATYASTLAVLATGTGKTVIASKIASEWPRGNILFLAERVELLDQAADKLSPELGYRPTVEQAARGLDTGCWWQGGGVLIGSVQTMRNEKRLAKFERYPFDLIIVDEAHHAVSAGYKKICEYFLGLNPQCKILGITATPSRSDKKALGVVFNSCAYEYPIAQAVNDGWLTPIRQQIITIEGVDFSGIRTRVNEFGESDFNQEDLQSILTEEEPLHALARPILERAAGRSCVVFAAGVPHARLLAAIINREQPGSAAVVDGESTPPGSDARRNILEGFRQRKIRYICNYGVLTEGWDCDFVSCVAMGRPTKSRLVYEQMLGRVLRPLDGTVDGYADASDRRMAILRSEKPFALCLDFVGNNKHSLVTVQDVLGGIYDFETRELAKRNAAEKMNADVLAELKKARAELLLMKEQEARRHIRADVGYRVEENDPLGDRGGVHVAPMEFARGGCSDAQIALLVGLGVRRDTAMTYTKKQAGAVIDSLKQKRCTEKQANVLLKHSFDANVPFDRAREIIDAIAASGWTLRGDE